MENNHQPIQKIGLLASIATMIGCVVGASIFILLGPITAKTGPSLHLAYILAFIPALFGSLIYVQLGAAMPSTGGSYVYANRLLSPLVGVNQAIIMIMAGIGANAMLAIGFAQYLHYYLPIASTMTIAVFILIALYLVNLLGLRLAGGVQIFMVAWMLLALLAFAIPGLFHVKPQGGEPLLAFGVSGLLYAAVLAFYSYSGFGIISELGGEVENPKKNIPLSIIISLLIVVFIYALVAYVSTGVMPWQQLAQAEASVPAAASIFLPRSIIVLIGIGALFATATTINAVMMAIPRELVALSKDKVLPLLLMKFNRFGVPYISLSIITVMSILLVLTGLNVDYFATITVVGLLAAAMLSSIAAWRLPKKLPDVYQDASFKIKPSWLTTIALIGFLTMLLFIVLAIMDLPSIGLIYLVLIVICNIYYFVIQKDKAHIDVVSKRKNF